MPAKKQTRIVHKINAFFLLAIITGLLIFLGVMIFSRKQNPLPVLGEPGHIVGSFSFTDQDGRKITDRDVREKVRVAEYFFTSCKSICPVMNTNLKQVQAAFKNRNDVIILSHTVDPLTDSLPRLKQYAEQMDAIAGKWEFLTGSKLSLYKMAEQSYLLSADSITDVTEATAFIHTQYVSLVDKQNRIRGFYDATDKKQIEKLIADIKSML
ncbi:MAG TPA: SCO family protein [Puia sp.]|nr:SCO family protein [Puia sp.]